MSNSNKNIYIEKNMFPNKNNQIIHNMNIFGRTNKKIESSIKFIMDYRF